MNHALRTLLAISLMAGCLPSFSAPPPVQEPSAQEDIRKALGGGVPMGR